MNQVEQNKDIHIHKQQSSYEKLQLSLSKLKQGDVIKFSISCMIPVGCICAHPQLRNTLIKIDGIHVWKDTNTNNLGNNFL